MVLMYIVLFGSFCEGKPWKDLKNGKYKDLKEEILESGYVSLRNYNNLILVKAQEYSDMLKATKVVSHQKAQI